MKTMQKHWDRLALAGILALAAFLTIWGIWNQGYSNEFYAAAVKSMTLSWKNFFFVSLDPGGWVTVDKPPVSLWIQAAFAKLLGFHGWSIILPQCLAAVGTVAIVQHVVRRHFGKIAGLLSALVLTLSPIFIVVSKTNNTDSILIFFMALATWAFMVAADKGKLRYLILSMVLLGIAYNAKTLEAFLILPGMYLAYFFATNLRWRKRIVHLLVATAVLAGVSLSWSLAVDLTPASERPYVDNSTNNSELELALGYNGIQRIFGQSGTGGSKSVTSGKMQAPTGGSSNTTSGSTSTQKTSNNTTSGSNQTSGNNGGSQGGPGGSFGGQGGPGSSSSKGSGGMSGMGGTGGNSMFNGGGSASILRMFNSTIGGQDSWLLPLGFFAILALLFGIRKSVEKDSETRKKRLRNLLVFGTSFLIMFVYFSVSSFFHAYYISVMCPFLAALVGIGIVEMWKFYKQSRGFTALLMPIAFAVTTAVQIVLLTAYPSYAKVLIPLIVVFAGIPTVILFIAKFLRKEQLKKISMAAVSGVTVAGLLIAPAVWTIYSVVSSNFNSAIPTAGPSSSESSSGGMPSGDQGGSQGGSQGGGQGGSQSAPQMSGSNTESGSTPQGNSNFGSHTMSGGFGNKSSSQSNTKLISFLLKNNTGEKWLIAVPDANEAESIILATGKPVMAIGGFSGNDNTLTVAKLKQLVKSGQLKYFMVGGNKGGNTSSDVTAWVKANGTIVDASKYSDTTSSSNSSSDTSSASTNSMGSSSTVIYDLSAYKNK